MPSPQTFCWKTFTRFASCGLVWLSGCGTFANLRTNGQHDPYLEGQANFIHFRGLDPDVKAPAVKSAYGGVRYDLYLHEVYSHGSDVYPIFGLYALCDLPLSLVADTVVLPVTLLSRSPASSEVESESDPE
jgi:uncharacterized protein YceK